MAFLWYRHLMRAFLWVCRVRQGGLSQNIVTSPQERCDPCHSIQCWIGLKAQTRVYQAECQPYVRLSFKGWRPPSWVTHRHSEKKNLKRKPSRSPGPNWKNFQKYSMEWVPSWYYHVNINNFTRGGKLRECARRFLHFWKTILWRCFWFHCLR